MGSISSGVGSSGFQLYNTLGIAKGDKAAYAKQAMENFNLFGAPHVAIIHTDEALGVYGAVDCGGYVTSFMLAAQALGLATVPQAALAFHSDLVRQHSASATPARSCAASRSAMPIALTRRTAIEPTGPRSRTWRHSSADAKKARP